MTTEDTEITTTIPKNTPSSILHFEKSEMAGEVADGALSPSAALRVFDTTELLENILLYLPLNTLLLSKRVSTQFRDVMAGSSKIRRALFFEPLSVPTADQIVTMSTYKPTLIKRQTGRDYYDHYLPSGITKHMPINPLLNAILSVGYAKYYGNDMCTIGVRSYLGYLNKPGYSDARASWRRMLALQPSATSIRVRSSGQCDVIDFWRVKPLEHGLRMGELYDIYMANCHGRTVYHLSNLQAVSLHPGVYCTWRRPVGDNEVSADLYCGWNVLAFAEWDGDREGV